MITENSIVKIEKNFLNRTLKHSSENSIPSLKNRKKNEIFHSVMTSMVMLYSKSISIKLRTWSKIQTKILINPFDFMSKSV